MPAPPVNSPAATTDPIRETAAESTSAIVNSFSNVVAEIIELAPKAVAALVVLIIGYLVARLVARAIVALCNKLGLQQAAERGGLVESMTQVGIERSLPQIVGTIVFWLLLCVFLVAACDILDLPAVTLAIQRVLAYIPRLLVATVLVVVGLLLASFLRGVVATSADRVGLNYAPQLANGCYYVLALMTLMAAFEQLDIRFDLLSYAILIAFGALALAIGLSLGLGGREVMAGILSGYYVRQRLRAGDRVSVAGFEGVIREIGPVATVIETEEEGLTHRRSIPNSRMLHEAVR